MKNKNNDLLLEIANFKLRVNTNYPNYYKYLDLCFGGIRQNGDSLSAPDIEINACWERCRPQEHLSQLRETYNGSMIGDNTFMADKRVVTIRKVAKRKKVLFDFKIENKKIYLNSFIQRKIFKDAVRYSLFGKREEELFFELTYPIIYYPLFWYSEYFFHSHLLHASAIEFDGKGIVICGLEGMGKTSLSLSLLQEKNSYFLSDNLIFYDNEAVYPCYELVRIHKHDDISLWQGKFERVTELRMSKDFCRSTLKLDKKMTKPTFFIFPKFSAHFSIEKISTPEAVNKAIILSNIPSELNNYVVHRNLYNLLDLQFNLYGSRYEVLGDLLAKSSCYEVGMPKSDGLEKNSKKLKEFIKSV